MSQFQVSPTFLAFLVVCAVLGIVAASCFYEAFLLIPKGNTPND